MILALAGGVGGARMASALAGVLTADRLTVVVNVGDDFTHLGLKVSPDLDTVMYTLAGRHDAQQGWGLAGDSGRCMAALAPSAAPRTPPAKATGRSDQSIDIEDDQSIKRSERRNASAFATVSG